MALANQILKVFILFMFPKTKMTVFAGFPKVLLKKNVFPQSESWQPGATTQRPKYCHYRHIHPR